MASKSDWAKGRLKYETRPNCTYEDIAEIVGVSRQAVHRKAKKEQWLKCTVDENLPVPEPKPGSALGVRSDENICEIVNVFALTGNKGRACRAVGIDDKTLYNWCQDMPELSREMVAAREAFLIGQHRKIADSKDWKAAQFLLSRAPETKDQFGETQEKGPRIILNIHRDEVVIDQ